MKKEKIHIEYVLDNASRQSLWNRISTPAGLSEWFADDISVLNNLFTFTWNRRHTVEAEMTAMIPNVYIRFHWIDDENPNTYFELRLHKAELTGGMMLEITDFAEPDEKEDVITLWNTQVKVLKRVLGI